MRRRRPSVSTPIDPEVANEMLPFIQSYFGNPSSSYSIGKSNKEAINRARERVASLINAKPDEIIFTGGGTESNNHAIRGIAFANAEKGKHIITSSVEHPAVTEVCQYLLNYGYEITWLPVDSYGTVDPKDVEKAIRTDTVLITIMHANNEVGTIQPIKKIGAIAKQNQVFFHTDASQSIGKIETDVTDLGVDLLTIAGHKLYAPKGIGALYIKQGTKIENLMYGAGQEKGMRPGTENVIEIVGLGKACELAEYEWNKNHMNMYAMRERLIEGLLYELNNKVKINTDIDNSLPNTLSIAFDNVEAHTLASVISNDVLISTGSACHADSIEISSVLKAMKLDKITAAGTVRISTGKHTSEEEIEKVVRIISEAVIQLSH